MLIVIVCVRYVTSAGWDGFSSGGSKRHTSHEGSGRAEAAQDGRFGGHDDYDTGSDFGAELELESLFGQSSYSYRPTAGAAKFASAKGASWPSLVPGLGAAYQSH